MLVKVDAAIKALGEVQTGSIAAQVFSPSPAEVLRARTILAHLQSSKAISMLDGEMLGPPMKSWALEVVRQAGEDRLDEAPACDPTDTLSATAPALRRAKLRLETAPGVFPGCGDGVGAHNHSGSSARQ